MTSQAAEGLTDGLWDGQVSAWGQASVLHFWFCESGFLSLSFLPFYRPPCVFATLDCCPFDHALDLHCIRQVGLPSDQLPEVPPDGAVQLSFTYPVDPALLQTSLKASNGAGLSVSPCIPSIASGKASAALTSCVQVKFVPGLAAGAAVKLQLPAGARYNPAAGGVGTAQEVQVRSVSCSRRSYMI